MAKALAVWRRDGSAYSITKSGPGGESAGLGRPVERTLLTNVGRNLVAPSKINIK